MIWKILEIEQTKDEETIKAAYRNKLRNVNPEDDEEGFKELRRAYEEALEYANSEEDSLHNVEDDEAGPENARKNDIDLWIDRVDVIYQNAKTRKDEEKWKHILNDPVCEDLDMELEAAEKLLVYFMSHSFMPQAIWKMVDHRFRYIENYDQLKEKFPENYLDYLKWQVEHSNFIDFELFDGKTDAHVDDYINTLYEEKNAFDENDMETARRLLNELSRYEITHPFTQVEEARFLLKKQQDEDGEYAKEALSIMEELDFEYSENPYIERIYAEALMENNETEKAKAIFSELLEASPDNYGAMLGLAKCIFLEGDAEEAKERIEDILEERVQDTESLKLLDLVNEKLVKDYEALVEQNMDRETCFKLGWCYYQQKKFEKGIALLDQLEPAEDYDYVNLRGRLYLANENYDKAYPLTKKWIKLIESSEDDGSKEMKKRKNRLSLAYFSIGVCMWETEYQKKKDKRSDQESVFAEAAAYISKGIEKENNMLVKLSYMEQLARFYLEEKKYTECVDICNEIIEKDRGFFPAYVHRQRANYELKNAKEVIDDYFACQEIYPGYSKPYVLAAEVFFAFDQYDDVENVIKAGKEADLDSDGLELYRIRCLHYKQFSEDNVKKALDAMLALKKKMSSRTEEEETDIEDLAEVEKELAILYWDLDKTDMALNIINDYIEKNPDAVIMLHLKMDVLNREKRYDEALEICRELIKLEPDNLYTRTKLGNCYERMENTEKAIECYRRILATDKNYVPAIRRLMYMYSYLSNQNNDMEKCKLGIKYATKLIETTGDAEGYVERGNLYIDLYELEQAVQDCKKAIELDSEAYYAYNNLGCALLKLRRIDEAVEPLEQVIRMEPDKDHMPYLNLAECYVLKKEYEKAIHAYNEVLRLRPKAFGMKEEIAKIYTKIKNFDKAVFAYQELINIMKEQTGDGSQGSSIFGRKRKKNSAESEKILSFYCDLADVYRQAGDYKNAEKYYKKVVSEYCSPFADYSPSRMEDVAEYYRDKGEFAEAEKILKKALKKVNTDKYSTAHLSFTYATVLFEMGRRKEALEQADIFIKDLFERHGGEENLLSDKRYRPMYLYDIAIMKICAGQFSEAKQYLERIKKCNLCVTCETCDCFEYYFGMGLLAELNNRKEEAKELYEKAIEIKGDYPCCERHLRNL